MLLSLISFIFIDHPFLCLENLNVCLSIMFYFVVAHLFADLKRSCYLAVRLLKLLACNPILFIDLL